MGGCGGDVAADSVGGVWVVRWRPSKGKVARCLLCGASACCARESEASAAGITGPSLLPLGGESVGAPARPANRTPGEERPCAGTVKATAAYKAFTTGICLLLLYTRWLDLYTFKLTTSACHAPRHLISRDPPVPVEL